MSMYLTDKVRTQRIRQLEMELSNVSSEIRKLDDFRKRVLKHLGNSKDPNKKDEVDRSKYEKLFIKVELALYDWEYLRKKHQEKLDEYLETNKVIAQARKARRMTQRGFVETKNPGVFIRRKPQKKKKNTVKTAVKN